MLSRPRKGEYAISVAGREVRLRLFKLTTTTPLSGEGVYAVYSAGVATTDLDGRKRVYRLSLSTSTILQHERY